MKKCPYCAEEIQDEAIKCRYCHSDLTAPRDQALQQQPATPATTAPSTSAGAEGPSPAASPSSSAAAPAPDPSPSVTAPASAGTVEPSPAGDPGSTVRYTHSGYRYVLGYGADFFAIWDRQSPSVPTERFSRTDEGWRQAWLRFIALEPKNVEVPQAGAAAPTGQSDPGDTVVVQYTHSGTRYLLGYGRTFFGIWDRQDPALPVERFPRTDDGWGEAWRRYTQIESTFAEVGLGQGGSGQGTGQA